MLTLFNSSSAQSDGARIIPQQNSLFQLEQIADGLGVPWGMTFLRSHQLLFTERQGNIKWLDLRDFSINDIKGGPEVFADGQGGMLDVVAGPDYENTGWIYFTYSKPTRTEAITTLARAKLIANKLVNWQDLLLSQSATDESYHFGSRIAFDEQGHVFFGIGDRGYRGLSQQLNNHAGAILRLNLDGSIPADNPFVGKSDQLDEIWSYGHRNPQGLQFDSEKRLLWSIEHGPRGGDEINLVLKARNYGWPVISHGKEYWGPIAIGEGQSKAGMEQPIKYYVPSIAPGSLLLYTGKAFPQWQGNLFAGALKLRHLNRITLSDDNKAIGEERLLTDLKQRVRSLAQSPEGWIYLATDRGNIFRMKPE